MTDLATSITLACILEATAAKPGNVYRGADFEDVTYADFLVSAVTMAPALASSAQIGVGQAVLLSVRSMLETVGTNTYLGTSLLIAPLAAVDADANLRAELPQVLSRLSSADTQRVYEAIRLAGPRGLGRSEVADVQDPVPELPLCSVMQLAAERDLVARQYTNDFADVFWVAERIAARAVPLGSAILHAYLQLLAKHPDSLIGRKCGLETSQQLSRRAAHVLSLGQPGDDVFDAAVADLDFWLRSDGHHRNPGTSADMIAAALFVLLREKRLVWPVRFYR